MAEGKHILIVEDNLDIAVSLKLVLEKKGYRVTLARSLRSAGEFVEKETFDLLISDIALPDGSGLDIMRLLKSSHDVKGIAISGYDSPEDIERSKSAGFEAHLVKPVNITVLLERIEQCLAEG